jgi:glycerophosphoryl diester phosphodiesterase
MDRLKKFGAWSVDLLRRFLQNGRSFLLVHLAVGLVVFVLLAPLATALLYLAVSLSGSAALSDQDILFFFLSPVGFIALLMMGAVFSIIVFLEHAALLTAAGMAAFGRDIKLAQVFGLLIGRAVFLFRLALLILLRILLILIPYVIAALLVYKLLLTDYDINYYLAEKPREWTLALGFGALILAALVLHLAWRFSGWINGLPLVLFSGIRPYRALQQSQACGRTFQRLALRGIAGWALVSLAVAALASWLYSGTGKVLIGLVDESLGTLLPALGLMALVGFVLSQAVAWFNASTLALINLDLFLDSGLEAPGGEATPTATRRQAVAHKPLRAARVTLLVLLGAAVLEIGLVYYSVNSLDRGGRTEIIAHRGASAAAPENTLAAIQLAIDSGADWVEIDVQETRDGEIVVIHDSDLKKVGGTGLAVARSTAAELRGVDIGSWFDPRFSDQRVPTLTEVLQLCKDRIGVIIELKYYGGEKRLEESTAERVEAAGMAEQVQYMSLNYRGIQRMRRIRPAAVTGLLSSVALGRLSRLELDFLALNARATSRRLVRHARLADKDILVWTVNDTVGISNMLSRGVDGIITDEPELAVAIRREHEELEPARRLLMQLADLFDQQALYAEQ